MAAKEVRYGDDARQRDDTEFGRTIIALSDIAEQARGRRHHDHPPVILLAKQIDRCPVDIEVAGQVHVDDRLPVLREHIVKHSVAQDAGGVEHDVQTAERLARLLDHRQAVVEFGDRPVVRCRIAAGRLDLVDDLLRRRLVGALAAAAGAGIVDHDLGAVRGHQFGDLSPDSASCSSAKCHPSLEHAHPFDP